MALDAAVLAQIRDWVGSTPDDDTVEAVFNRDDVGTVNLAALAILRQRRADLENGPDSFEVVGDYKETTIGKAFESLSNRIAELETLTGASTQALTAGQLYRTDICR